MASSWIVARPTKSDGKYGAAGLRSAKYDETLPLIEAASPAWLPDGMEFHVAFSADGHFRVSEVWDLMEQFEAFGKVLMPILTEHGIELAGPPEILEVHNSLRG